MQGREGGRNGRGDGGREGRTGGREGRTGGMGEGRREGGKNKEMLSRVSAQMQYSAYFTRDELYKCLLHFLLMEDLLVHSWV